MSAHSENRHATWLELFFDLIFVVAIAKAAHVLQHPHHGHIETLAYFKYILIMIPVWWAWVGATLYANRFDCDDVWQRLMSFAQMFCIIILAANINTDFDAYYKGFLFSYVGIRLLTVGMYLRASLHKPETRQVSNFLALAFGTGALISLSSLFFDGLARYIVLYAGIGFDVVMPLLAKKRLQAVPVHAHHLPERLGLLTIILLGESVLSLTNSFDALAWTPLSLAMAACGFILACSLWWLYFENIERRIAGHHLGHAHGIIYPHLFIYAGLGGIAAMIRFAVVPELALFDYKLLSGLGMLTFMLALQFLHFVYHPSDMRKHLLRNAILFNGSFIALLIFAPSIPLIVTGTAALLLLYVTVDHLNTKHTTHT
jgi:low temperature requirement protein LtrA